MKEFSYVPKSKVVDGVEIPAAFTGKIGISIPKFTERVKLLKEVQFGNTVPGQSDAANNLDFSVKMAEIAKSHTVRVALTRVSTQETLSSFEDLEYDTDGTDLINQIGHMVLTGISLGKN